ncbi:hypothetical protein BUALT_Bualt15G0098900 [Buddleja alternifolia]|uniref:F-box domain-containing protein n=1 Tax=Buddleja alternifolia TaxID=168488 RepID=A0AAV6WFG7_9LAMI|nr:hypothetical protein BUALT_Bualt15G0098900 [Buddleja alternifolia]
MHGLKRRIEHFSEVRGKNLIDELHCTTTETSTSRLKFPLLELPVHIICDILSRLPLKDIFHCRCVCKLFLNLLKDPYFAKVHLARAPISTTNLILQENVGKWGALHFFTFDLGDSTFSSCSSDDQNIKNKNQCYFRHGLHLLSKSDAEFCFPTQRLTLVGSCNGLLCLYFDSPSKPFFGICNPILCESIKLPRIITSSPPPVYTYANHSSFGYCPRTKQYKVISFMYLTSSIDSKRVVAEVHTVGSDSWRRIESAPFPKIASFDPFFNGSLHWITNSSKPSELISSFDLEKEKFIRVPPPPHFNAEYVNKVSWINTGVLRDCLCLCYIYEDSEFEVWVMREYGVKDSWRKEFSIDMKFYYDERCDNIYLVKLLLVILGRSAPFPKIASFDPFFNGSLHWITNSSKPSELISSFDLEKEKFIRVPPPPHFNAEYVNKVSWINTGVLRDCLCLCYIYEDSEFEVWVMREYGVKDSWRKEFSIDMKFYCKLRVEDFHRPIKFLSNGDLWFISSCDSLVCFSPRKRTFRELRSMGPWTTEVTAHDLSFVSLKDVMGVKSRKVKNFRLERPRYIFGV